MFTGALHEVTAWGGIECRLPEACLINQLVGSQPATSLMCGYWRATNTDTVKCFNVAIQISVVLYTAQTLFFFLHSHWVIAKGTSPQLSKYENL